MLMTPRVSRAMFVHKEVDVSCQQPAAKGVGFVMSIAILVAMIDGPVFFRATVAPLSSRVKTTYVRRALSAAAGHRAATSSVRHRRRRAAGPS
jgi:hypothetical protein